MINFLFRCLGSLLLPQIVKSFCVCLCAYMKNVSGHECHEEQKATLWSPFSTFRCLEDGAHVLRLVHQFNSLSHQTSPDISYF